MNRDERRGYLRALDWVQAQIPWLLSNEEDVAILDVEIVEEKRRVCDEARKQDDDEEDFVIDHNPS